MTLRQCLLAGPLLLGLALAAPSPAQDAASPPAPAPAPAGTEPYTWYAQAMARGEAGLNVTHFWSKGPLLRAETVVAGHKVVTIVNGEWYYAYDGLTGLGLAIRRDPAAQANDSPTRRPFGNEYESLLRQGAELVREENLLGRRAGVYRVTDQLGMRELWTTLDEQHLPLRLEIYDRRTSARRYTDYVNWQTQLAIPDKFFQPDAWATLERMELEEYLTRTATEGPTGPVPVLYANLLTVRKRD